MICYLFEPSKYLIFAPNLPELLYYSHVPATIGALIVGLFVLMNDRKVLLNKILFFITAAFSAWTVTNLIAWTNNNHSEITSFLWPIFAGAAALISFLSIYFVEVFVTKQDVSPRKKVLFLLLLLPVFAFGFSNFNFSGFDLVNCDPFMFTGPAFQIYYTSLGVVAITWIAYRIIKNYPTANQDFKKQLLLIGVGMESFLAIFFGSDLLGTYLSKLGLLEDSQIEFFGILGMLVFLMFISILIVRFKAFNIKLIGAQALVTAIAFLTGSQIFTASGTIDFVISGTTFLLSLLFGYFLIKSVKNEVLLREQAEGLVVQLKTANDNQTNLIHVMNHQIKGRLGNSRNIFAELLTGDYGQVPDTAKPLLEKGLEETTTGVNYVTTILKGASAESGTLPFNLAPMDFKALVTDVADKQRPFAERKGLQYAFTVEDGVYQINGDTTQLSEAVKNLIDNSINYTLQGSISVSLGHKDGKILFAVKDSGVGITDEDKQKLFRSGGRGKDSISINVNSTGYGLAFVKGVVTAHSGHVWAESEGKGKGSQFYMELPEVK